MLRSATAIVLALTAVLPAQERPAAPPPARRAPPVAEVSRRAGDFRIETKVAIPAGAQSLEIWVPAPRVDDAQSVTESAAPAPQGGVVSQQTDPESGNTYLHLRIQYPQGTIAFDTSWKFERREQSRAPFRRAMPRDFPEPDPSVLARDLVASELVPVTGRIKARAAMVVPSETDPLNVARAIYDEVLRTVEFGTKGEGWGKGDALWALDAGYGDSADFAALFVGLLRSRGIPARFVMGFPLPAQRADGDSEIPGYAAWAEFFVADLGWIPVDLAGAKLSPETRQYAFGSLNERRIQFTTGRDVRTAPPSRRGTHNYFIYPYAEVDGEPAAVTHRLMFKEK